MTAPPSGRARARVLPPAPRRAAVTMLLFTAALYLFEAIDQASGGMVDAAAAIYPRDTSGLTGILTAPLLHVGYVHLAANTLPFLLFGFLAMSGGIGQWFAVTATIWVISGVGVWLISPAAVLGASGIVFGWFVFLLARGFYARNGRQIALAVVLFLIWGSLLWGVLPSDPRVSWQAHLFGALGGLVAASWVAKADRRPAPTLGA
ncbi:Membrane associated serine protease, rhomboid family [Pseudonocardia ammonioxydans]|uniref:Membrane associated serine protease, rhomboid family n=1 Tax=Pseudonocardia ammonioxydans TaxID=260086 RepID=A0A1I4VZE8_PSUAM|nr:rhomboid family intramembrane serine protease [Pseudonocardia ammonioxydans]SFN06376.1 Membrane associated serine protease, rhomboid family [Pseudonocardia ammonioxydans]